MQLNWIQSLSNTRWADTFFLGGICRESLNSISPPFLEREREREKFGLMRVFARREGFRRKKETVCKAACLLCCGCTSVL